MRDQRFSPKMKNKFSIIIPPQDIACKPDCLERFVKGDRKAFDWLYKNYSRKVFNYAMIITGDESLSEDIVQDVFLRLWMNREKLSGINNFNGYLYRMQKNLVTNFMKRKVAESHMKERYEQKLFLSDHQSINLLDFKEQQSRIENLIRNLSKQQQIVFRLNKEYGWKRNQIAYALQISPFTVKCHLQKALTHLRNELAIYNN